MSTRRSTTERIDAQKEKMELMQKEMQRLKRLHGQEERKVRNHRISRRGAHMESILPDTIMLSDARFWTFLEKTVANKFGRDILAALKAEQEKEDAKNAAAAPASGGDTAAFISVEDDEADSELDEADETEPAQAFGALASTKTAEANRQGA
jgi:hypothetical protein